MQIPPFLLTSCLLLPTPVQLKAPFHLFYKRLEKTDGSFAAV